MAFGKNVAKGEVLVEYKAVTADHVKKLKQLAAEQKKVNETIEKGGEVSDKSLSGMLDKYGALAAKAIAFGVAAKGAFDVASSGIAEYQKQAQLAAATQGVNLDGLRKSSQGLVSDTRLLELAAASMNGTFKLSQQQMQDVVQGALALRKEGKDLTHTLERVQQAVTEGTVEPLKELGLVIKGPENDTQEGLNAAIAALRDEAKGMGGDFTLAGDDVTKASVELENAMSDLKEAIGAIAVALAPVVKIIAEMVGGVADLARAVANLEGQKLVSAGLDLLGGGGSARAVLSAAQAERDRMIADDLALTREQSGRVGFSSGGAFEAPLSREARAEVERQLRGPQRRRGRRGPGPSMSFGEDEGMFLLMGRSSAGRGPSRVVGGGERSFMDPDAAAEAMAQFNADIMAAAAPALEAAREQSILSTIFGTPAEIDAQTMALEGFAAVMDGFVGAFGAGVDALITGSKSFGEAFKDAIAESARALSVEFAMQALRHSLFAVGSLAFGNIGGAAAHGKAAAGYAAGAVGVGALARGLGAGQSQASTPTTTGSAGVGPATRGAQGGGNRTTVFLLDEAFGEMPPGQRAALFRKKGRRAGMSFEGDAVLDG